ncbi:phosphatidate cytidylyltransferase [Cricetibacter osteomyelitidis]|uniref:Phosphatidate cytidylyltransferase n=1 Tax=Cricetibacter osteomyelitidis TaxID=1521931 RepID=A0A4R2T1H1_9PAST|nr:phosphatidate cytidylyltransferase [Cricetibacter osteomyelitidis]TCP94966.1 phosphatidate cytidylyltransferase [Cricetibacter osteomyelitidis]
MLKQRVISAIVLIGIVFAALFLFSPFAFALAVAVVVAIGVWEWTQFMQFKMPIWRGIITGIAASFLFLWVYAEADFLNAGRVFVDLAQPILLSAVIWWFAALILVISYPKSAALWGKSLILQFIFAFFTLVPFLIGILSLRLDHYITNPTYGVMQLLYVFILIWGADSGAYFAGRAFGKHKLAPKVSPGKTWQGVFGGLVTAGVIAYLFLQFASVEFVQQIKLGGKLTSFLGLSVATVAISVLGDLTESMFKRTSGIKDSGNIIPGHGGVLDRIDSLTAAVPFFAYFYFFVI